MNWDLVLDLAIIAGKSLLLLVALLVFIAFMLLADRNFGAAFFDAAGGGGWGPVVTSNLLVQGGEPRKVVGTVNSVEFFLTVAVSATFISQLGVAELADGDRTTLSGEGDTLVYRLGLDDSAYTATGLGDVCVVEAWGAPPPPPPRARGGNADSRRGDGHWCHGVVHGLH